MPQIVLFALSVLPKMGTPLLLLLTIFALSAAIPPNHQNNGRIFYGTLATKGQFPYQVALLINRTDILEEDLCGGALISNQWVLTAAHCLLGEDIETVKVVLGTVALSHELDPNLVNIDAAEVRLHEMYMQNAPRRFDIALVKLARPAPLSDNINTIALSSEVIKPGTAVTVAGWGMTNESLMPIHLRYIHVRVESEDACNKVYGERAKQMLCTVSDHYLTVCKGDKGGPLVANTSTGVVHVGVSSFGAGSCGTRFPDVYTRTDMYRDWIRGITGI